MSLMVTEKLRCMAPADALELMEQLEAQLSPKRDNEIAWAMNTVRYALARDIPAEPTLHDGKTWKYYYTCGRCGAGLHTGMKYCGACGQRCTDHYLGRRRTKEEQKEGAYSPAQRQAIEDVARSLTKPEDVRVEDYL